MACIAGHKESDWADLPLFLLLYKKNKEFNLIMINRIYDQNSIADRKISDAQCKILQFTFTFLPRLRLKMAF